MGAIAARANSEGDAAPVKPVLEVLVLYEDLATALRAKQSLDRLPGRSGITGGLVTRLWRLDLLGEPLLAERSAIEAAAADVIIVSLHGRKALRAEARHWFCRWLDHKEDRPYALAAFLDPEPAQAGGDNPVLAYLKCVAAAAGADLFCGSSPVPVPR